MARRTPKKTKQQIDGKRKVGIIQPEYFFKKHTNRSDLKKRVDQKQHGKPEDWTDYLRQER